MKKIIPYVCICFSFFMLASCGGGGGATGGEEKSDYDTTKKMVTDILKTDEGKQAMTDVLSDEKMQKTYVIESKVVEQAVTDTLTSDEGKEYWKKMFEDPKFVESFAKSMQAQQEDVIKGLMSDSEYQKKMIEILSNPDMEDQMLTVLKGQQFREHLEKTIQETLDSPLYKAKITDIVIKAAEEMKPSEGSGGESGGSGEEGGGESGGGGQ
ncbi:spore germination lipoprotein GerD [Aquibacillus rhizosphaerae]|uniref:Spore germination lipoprotein GerD n=1 Tax=Aquibacillus rhizosphaerae TaxID=3051431 RepID=A0ABT7L6E7_9BACI|nr:spore germination lipoprotein GerD [Aquibacillus sp. LR5S19]MDL4841423.1 spore germination lipoprotein GerD [Aquibacillus sp. LR5S19]